MDSDIIPEKPQLKRQKDIALEGLQLLINAVEIANKRGAFTLAESAEIYKVVSLFVTKTPEPDFNKEN